jgi:hypothetical protein
MKKTSFRKAVGSLDINETKEAFREEKGMADGLNEHNILLYPSQEARSSCL